MKDVPAKLDPADTKRQIEEVQIGMKSTCRLYGTRLGTTADRLYIL